jgi:hypothetical protein
LSGRWRDVVAGEEPAVGAGAADFDHLGGLLVEMPWVSPEFNNLLLALAAGAD